MKTDIIEEQIAFAEIDHHFGQFIARFGGDKEIVQTVAALVSRSVRQGHICLDLADPSIAASLNAPAAKLLAQLERSPAFGPPDADTPIVIASDRLYLRRYWD